MTSRPNVFDRLRFLRRFGTPSEVAFARRFGRTPLSILFRIPVLLLETTGRRSGLRRTTVLAYERDGDGSILIVGGAGGQTRTPDWVANLRADPHVVVTVDGRRTPMVATELTGAEREAVWRRLADQSPRITTYERRAGHTVPVFRLR